MGAASAVVAAALMLSTDASATRVRDGIAIIGVGIVDLETGRILPHRTVIIRENRISEIHPGEPPLGPGVRRVAGEGKYLLPGLWDMHVHLTDPTSLGLFVVNGVVGVRDMGGGLDRATDGCESLNPTILGRWRSEIASRRRLGPELVISGPPASGSGSPTTLRVTTTEEARTAVATLRAAGMDFMKVYDGIPLTAYLAMAREARAYGLPFAGHVPEEVPLVDAILAGQRSIEHVRDPLLVCYTPDRAELERFMTADAWGDEDRRWGRSAHAACPAIIAALKANETWLTPTLNVERAKIAVEDPRFRADPRRRLLPPSVQDGFFRYAADKLAQDADERSSERLWWQTQQRLVYTMSREQVSLLAGTDAACQGGLPGFSLHDELALMVEAGLSPLQALRAATVEPARYLDRPLEGAIKQGMRANLVLLDGNPLLSIANSRRVRGVVLNGRFLDRRELDTLIP